MGRRGDGGGVGEIFLLSYGLRFSCKAGVYGLGERSFFAFFSFGPDGRLIHRYVYVVARSLGIKN